MADAALQNHQTMSASAVGNTRLWHVENNACSLLRSHWCYARQSNSAKRALESHQGLWLTCSEQQLLVDLDLVVEDNFSLKGNAD